MILKRGIRNNPLEFDISDDCSTVRILKNVIFPTFFCSYCHLYLTTKSKYLIGKHSLFVVKDEFIPICILKIYESEPNDLLVEKNFKDILDKEVYNQVYKIIEHYIKDHKIVYIENLLEHIFTGIYIPKFDTVENMEIWLNKVKNKWLKNERKKIIKAEKEVLVLS